MCSVPLGDKNKVDINININIYPAFTSFAFSHHEGLVLLLLLLGAQRLLPYSDIRIHFVNDILDFLDISWDDLVHGGYFGVVVFWTVGLLRLLKKCEGGCV